LRQVNSGQKYHNLENLQAICPLVCGIHVTGVYLHSTSLRYLHFKNKYHIFLSLSHIMKPIISVSLSLFYSYINKEMGQSGAVDLATGHGMDGLGFDSRWGEIFRTCPDRPWGSPSPHYGYRFSHG
jgi:hypothetical protein